MKICFINPTKKLRKGLINLVKCFARNKGNDLVVLTPSEVENVFVENNVELIIYPSFFLPKIRYTIPYFFKQYRILKNIIERKKVDIIHCWSYFYPVNFVPLFLARKNKIPIVSTVDTFPGINWSYGGLFLLDWLEKGYSKTIGRFVLNKMDKVILMGRYLEVSANILGIKGYEVIPLCVDTERFNAPDSSFLKEEFGIKRGEKVLINIGRLVPVKSIPSLIDLTRALLNKGYEIKTLIVGGGPYEQKYRKMAQGFENKIIFTGERKNIADLLAISDIFVCASVSEGLPNALLEASAAGKAIVAVDRGGISEIVEDQQSGFVVENQRGLLPKIELLLNDEALCHKLGFEAKQRMRQFFSQEIVLDKYYRLYETFIR